MGLVRKMESILPRDIVCLILEFDGSLQMAIRKQFIGCVYVDVYREAFGWYFWKHSPTRTLEMAKYCHKHKPWAMKRRRCKKYMKPWWRAFGKELEIFLYKFGIWKRAMTTKMREGDIQKTVIEQLTFA